MDKGGCKKRRHGPRPGKVSVVGFVSCLNIDCVFCVGYIRKYVQYMNLEGATFPTNYLLYILPL
jgi:hypothetical protein